MWTVARHKHALAAFAPLTVLLAATVVMGAAGITAIRALFVFGCIVVSWRAWRYGAGVHLQTTIALFSVAPLLRRVVDLGAGYDASGLMLTGPFLAILLPGAGIRALNHRKIAIDPAVRPFLVASICAVYAALISIFQGDMTSAAAGTLKWISPLVYGAWLHEQEEEKGGLVAAAVQAFAVIMPLLGIYGIFQYVAPPPWDRYWMVYSQMITIGLPEPYAVRVFGTMNSPASYATFMACALLLIGLCRSGWTSIPAALPCLISLLLSLYRTAWIAMVVGVLVCLLAPATRRRAALLAASCGVGFAIALVATPFADVIASRLETFAQGGDDYSVHARFQEYGALFQSGNGTLLGHGFGDTVAGQGDTVSGRIDTMPIDGQLVACWSAMGMVLGIVCVAAIVCAGWQAMVRTTLSGDPTRAALGAVVASMMVQIPLAIIAWGEIGVLFWGFVGIATARAACPHHDLAAELRGMATIGRGRSMLGRPM